MAQITTVESVYSSSQAFTDENFLFDNVSLWNFTKGENFTMKKELPIDMKFNDGHRLAIISHSVLMFLSAIGNISVFVVIFRIWMKGRLSRINLFLLHLAIADLLVTFLLMPLEVSES